MFFKSAKSRSVVLKKESNLETFCFSVDEILIPTIKENPVKSLGKICDATLRDKAAIRNTNGELKQWLQKVERDWPRRAVQFMEESSGHCLFISFLFPPLLN